MQRRTVVWIAASSSGIIAAILAVWQGWILEFVKYLGTAPGAIATLTLVAAGVTAVPMLMRQYSNFVNHPVLTVTYAGGGTARTLPLNRGVVLVDLEVRERTGNPFRVEGFYVFYPKSLRLSRASTDGAAAILERGREAEPDQLNSVAFLVLKAPGFPLDRFGRIQFEFTTPPSPFTGSIELLFRSSPSMGSTRLTLPISGTESGKPEEASDGQVKNLLTGTR